MREELRRSSDYDEKVLGETARQRPISFNALSSKLGSEARKIPRGPRRSVEFPRNNLIVRALVKALENGPSDGKLWEVPVDFGPFRLSQESPVNRFVVGSNPTRGA